MQSKSGLRFGVALPQDFPEKVIDHDLIHSVATRAEAAGFYDLWCTESITGTHTILEPVTMLSYVAGFTDTIRLGVSVMVLPQRNPIQLAKALSSLDQLSRGRLTPGIGLGTGPKLYPAFGISSEHRVTRFTESIRIMRALWTQPEVNFKGRFFQLEGITMEPKPAQAHVPLWIGASSEPAMRRAARLGDGWMGRGAAQLTMAVPEIEMVNRIVKEEGRTAANFTISKKVYIAIDDDEDRARKRLGDWFQFHFGRSEMATTVAVAGSPQRCAETLAPMVAAGISHLVFQPVFDQADHVEMIAERLAPLV